MTKTWSPWKPFPDLRKGGHLDAPIGPGVYEVRHVETNELIAFGPAASVAHDLIKVPAPAFGLRGLFRASAPSHPIENLEYRTYAATSVKEASVMAAQLRDRRDVFWRARHAPGRS